MYMGECIQLQAIVFDFIKIKYYNYIGENYEII